MPKLNVSVKHHLPQQEALERIQRLLQNLKNEYGDKISDLDEKWSDTSCNFRFKAMGFSVSGTLDVGTGSVKLAGDLPFAASLFKSKIESIIHQQVRRLLA